jgi:hypothetical protein
MGPKLGGAVALVALVAGCGGSAPPPVGDPGAPRALAALAQRTQAQIPGALPASYRPVYVDSYHGWPVRPLHAQHPIRGSFLDPRGIDENGLAGYHFGVDVNVDDAHPQRGAPTGLSHRVYAMESGVAHIVHGTRFACANRRLDVGHFSYWHVSPTVRMGQVVKAGTPIGWTCIGQWHVHVSEWQLLGGKRVWVNPLLASGKFAPYADTEPPIVSGQRFFTPPRTPWDPDTSLRGLDSAAPLAPTRLRGLVELRAQIEDAQSYWGFLRHNPGYETPHHPYRVGVEIRSSAGKVVLQRISFQSDQLPATPYLVHYAPGSVQNGSMDECVHAPQGGSCPGTYWFRPFSRNRLEFWNTHTVKNGTYDVTVVAWDLKGNVGSLSIPVVVAN